MRIMQTTLEKTAEVLGYDHSKLVQRGTNSLNIVYSVISRFEQLFLSMLNMVISEEVDFISMEKREDVLEVARVVAHIFEKVLHMIIIDEGKTTEIPSSFFSLPELHKGIF